MPGEINTNEFSLVPEREILKPKIGITVTHHLPDTDYPWLSLEPGGGFAKTIDRLKEAGVTKERFDVRWSKVAPAHDGKMDIAYLERSAKIAEIGNRAGLENVIVLSSAPGWALELAKTDPDSFIQAYESYVDTVFSFLAKSGAKPPSGIQIFNELNMRNYTPVELLPHLFKCTAIVQEKSEKHFGKRLPLLATLQVSSPLSLESVPKFMEGALPFIEDRSDLLALFDQIDLDYYPGIWHQPAEAMRKHLKNIGYYLKVLSGRKDSRKVSEMRTPLDVFRTFSDMGLLEQTLKSLQPLAKKGVKIGIGEIGIPSITLFETEAMESEHQKLQTVGLGIILRKLRPIVEKYGLAGVGIYSLMDESKPEVGLLNWGLFSKEGRERHIVDRLAKVISRVYGPPNKSGSQVPGTSWT